MEVGGGPHDSSTVSEKKGRFPQKEKELPRGGGGRQHDLVTGLGRFRGGKIYEKEGGFLSSPTLTGALRSLGNRPYKASNPDPSNSFF